MATKTKNDKILLGLKVRQLRQESNRSLSSVAKAAGLSVSYLNEIERGKKYPKPDKLRALSTTLDIGYDTLISKDLSPSLEPLRDLLQSNFLNELPLDLFGIEQAKVIELIANAPARVGAFISALVELARNYGVPQKNFYFAALRSYLELHDNYFEDIEQQVEALAIRHQLDLMEMVETEELATILCEEFKYKIIDDGLAAYPDLQHFRSIYIPKRRRLLLKSGLTDTQRAFQFAKELGFHTLGLQDRATTSSLMRANTFEEVLSHSRAIYFAVALLLPRQRIIKDLKNFFGQSTWQPQIFLQLMENYGATPEMFYHRLTNILPQFFGLKQLLFVRVVHTATDDRFEIDRELHLHDRHYPHQSHVEEHYCRRWSAIAALCNLDQNAPYQVSFQRALHYGTEQSYLYFTIARSGYPRPDQTVSTTIGLRIDAQLKSVINFWNDSAIVPQEINQSCERCPIENCSERVISPTVIEQRSRRRAIELALENALMS